ncbi:MAG: hypothetical protein AVDCRST_MAG05-2867, partial [uncultured Rubrobacteraceae bacterium]
EDSDEGCVGHRRGGDTGFLSGARPLPARGRGGRAHRRPDTVLHLLGRRRRIALGPRGGFPPVRLSRDTQGILGLQGKGVGHVPLHRLPDGLLVAAPEHARLQRDRFPGPPVHRPLIPPAAGGRGRGAGPELHLPDEDPHDRGSRGRRDGLLYRVASPGQV